MNFKLLIPRSISVGHCPNCNTVGSLDRIKRDSIWDNILLSVFKIRGYHCRVCKYDGKFFLFKLTKNALRVIANYCIMVSIIVIVILLLSIILKKC